MSNFGGNAGQDWETVNVGRSTKPFKKPTQGDKKQSLTSAQRSGAAVSQARQFATANKSVGGHGPMGTSAGAGARKLAEETETFKVQKTGLAFGKALMQARMAKKMSQKDLGTKINEKPQVIQQYEQGKAVPNPAIISKLERALESGRGKGSAARQKMLERRRPALQRVGGRDAALGGADGRRRVARARVRDRAPYLLLTFLGWQRRACRQRRHDAQHGSAPIGDFAAAWREQFRAGAQRNL